MEINDVVEINGNEIGMIVGITVDPSSYTYYQVKHFSGLAQNHAECALKLYSDVHRFKRDDRLLNWPDMLQGVVKFVTKNGCHIDIGQMDCPYVSVKHLSHILYTNANTQTVTVTYDGAGKQAFQAANKVLEKAFKINNTGGNGDSHCKKCGGAGEWVMFNKPVRCDCVEK